MHTSDPTMAISVRMASSLGLWRSLKQACHSTTVTLLHTYSTQQAMHLSQPVAVLVAHAVESHELLAAPSQGFGLACTAHHSHESQRTGREGRRAERSTQHAGAPHNKSAC